ncbi:MAG TPA: hypothetical protein VNQ56_10220 [Pseudolabrys sp.]|nr:hypothetical protein [Pseudolabrys sp.]
MGLSMRFAGVLAGLRRRFIVGVGAAAVLLPIPESLGLLARMWIALLVIAAGGTGTPLFHEYRLFCPVQISPGEPLLAYGLRSLRNLAQ